MTTMNDAIDTRDLTLEEIDSVSGGDRAREAAVLEAVLELQRMELTEIEVEPVPHVPMKLPC
jgi:hypothetical protein